MVGAAFCVRVEVVEVDARVWEMLETFRILTSSDSAAVSRMRGRSRPVRRKGGEDVHLKRELAPVPGELALGAAREDARVVREEVQRVVVEDVAGEAADVVEGGEVADVRRGDAAAGAGRGVDATAATT